MRKHPIVIFFALALIYLVLGVLTWWLSRPLADFILRCIVSLGIFGAVFAALFGDYLREKFFPIKINIEVPDESKNILDDIGGGKVYIHHLVVKNLTPHRTIENCRAWLKKIEEQQDNDEWMEKTRFAVPQLMEWAPSEYSRDIRTFIKQQVFDLGRVRQNNGGFLLALNRVQGDAIPRQFPVGKKLRFTFFVSADNYLDEKEFCFEVDVLPTVQGDEVNPAKVTPVVNRL